MRNYCFLVLLLSCSSPNFSYATTNILPIIHQYIQQADSLAAIEYGRYNKAIHLAHKALLLCEQADCHSKIDSFLIEAYSIIGASHINLSDYQKGFIFLIKEHSLLKNQQPINTKKLSNCYNNMGLCVELGGDYDGALVYYKKVLALDLENDHLQGAAITYGNMAICFSNKQDYQKALLYEQKALELRRSLEQPNVFHIAISINNIASYYEELHQYSKAIAHYHEALDSLTAVALNNDLLTAQVYKALGTCYRSRKQNSLAFSFCKKALELVQKYFPDEKSMLVAYHQELGLCYQSLKNYPKALVYLQQTLDMRQELLEANHPDIVHTYLLLANLHQTQQQFSTASEFLLAAFNILNKSIKHPILAIPQDPLYLSYLVTKGTIYYDWYWQSNQVEHLGIAKKTFTQAVAISEKLRLNLQEKISKQSHLDNYYAIQQHLMDIYYHYWQETQDSSYLIQAFALLEKSKSVLLIESLQAHHARQLAKIPMSLLKKEAHLRTQINVYENHLYQKDSTPYLYQQLVASKNAHQELIEQLEDQYPAYRHLKKARKSLSISAIQAQLLQPEQAILNYFVSKKATYAFVISQEKVVFQRLPDGFPLQESVQGFTQSIQDFGEIGNDKKCLHDRYCQDAYALYQQLIEPLQAILPPKLIIIPHDILEYIAFDALLFQAPKKTQLYASYPYLLQRYEISYAYSANWLAQLQANSSPKAPKTFVAFAPEFTHPNALASRGQHLPFEQLQENIPEVEQAAALFQGDSYTGNAATKSTFQKVAPDYQIIHLATHGFANHHTGDYSYLAFAKKDSTSTHELLYTNEIYQLSLLADMVVLSACQTSMGELQKGEGIFSLARGFSAAGAKSLITSLWNANDVSSARLMALFYEELQENKSKSAALRQARRKFLQKNRNQHAHPYYWAAFIPIGDMQAISLPKRPLSAWRLVSFTGLIIYISTRKFLPKSF